MGFWSTSSTIGASCIASHRHAVIAGASRRIVSLSTTSAARLVCARLTVRAAGPPTDPSEAGQLQVSPTPEDRRAVRGRAPVSVLGRVARGRGGPPHTSAPKTTRVGRAWPTACPPGKLSRYLASLTRPLVPSDSSAKSQGWLVLASQHSSIEHVGARARSGWQNAGPQWSPRGKGGYVRSSMACRGRRSGERTTGWAGDQMCVGHHFRSTNRPNPVALAASAQTSVRRD